MWKGGVWKGKGLITAECVCSKFTVWAPGQRYPSCCCSHTKLEVFFHLYWANRKVVLGRRDSITQLCYAHSSRTSISLLTNPLCFACMCLCLVFVRVSGACSYPFVDVFQFLCLARSLWLGSTEANYRIRRKLILCARNTRRLPTY